MYTHYNMYLQHEGRIVRYRVYNLIINVIIKFAWGNYKNYIRSDSSAGLFKSNQVRFWTLLRVFFPLFMMGGVWGGWLSFLNWSTINDKGKYFRTFLSDVFHVVECTVIFSPGIISVRKTKKLFIEFHSGFWTCFTF